MPIMDIINSIAAVVLSALFSSIMSLFILPIIFKNFDREIYLYRKKVLRYFNNDIIQTHMIFKCKNICMRHTDLSKKIGDHLKKNYEDVTINDTNFTFKMLIDDVQLQTEIKLLIDGTDNDEEPINNDEILFIGEIECMFSMPLQIKQFNKLHNYKNAKDTLEEKFNDLNIKFNDDIILQCDLKTPPKIYHDNLCNFNLICGERVDSKKNQRIEIDEHTILIYSEYLSEDFIKFVKNVFVQYI